MEKTHLSHPAFEPPRVLVHAQPDKCLVSLPPQLPEQFCCLHGFSPESFKEVLQVNLTDLDTPQSSYLDE